MIVLDKENREIELPDYDNLINKPSINGVILEGNKTSAELGLNIDTTNFYTKSQSDNKFQPKGDYATQNWVESNFATNSDVDDEIGKLEASLEGQIRQKQPIGDYATVDYVDSENEYLRNEIDGKQPTLVSGTNIKTINGVSILGSGNIEIVGGGSETQTIASVYITNETSSISSNLIYTGDLNGVIDAIKNSKPFLAYFYNKTNNYGVVGILYELTHYRYSSNNDTGVLYYHTEFSGQHLTIGINFSWDETNSTYKLDSVGYQQHNYLTSVPSQYVTETELNDTLTNRDYATVDYVDSENEYLRNEIDGKQPIGNYVTQTELDDALAGIDNGVAYLIIKQNNDNTFSYIAGSLEDVVNAYNNNQPYFIYLPNGSGNNYYSLAETTIISDNYIQCLTFSHTGSEHKWRYWRLYPAGPTLYSEQTYEYATKTYVDNKIGNINTILENIIN